MKIEEWEQRYRSGERAAEDLYAPPTPLVIKTASDLPPGRALDIACGTGRNAIWLAEHGWQVTAADGAPVAIEILEQRARERGLNIGTRVADLEAPRQRIRLDAHGSTDSKPARHYPRLAILQRHVPQLF